MPQLVREGVVLAYEEAGSGEPALVFVHGVACNRGIWASQMRHFAGRHRVVAVDLRGHGASEAPQQRYTMRTFAGDLVWMCAQLRVARPVVIGHSLGGLVALELASADPGQVSGSRRRVASRPGDRTNDRIRTFQPARGPGSGQRHAGALPRGQHPYLTVIVLSIPSS